MNPATADTEPAPPVYKRHDPCQGGGVMEFTEEEWKLLPFVGIGPAEDDDKVLEYRNCPCGSTITVEHPKSAVEPTIRQHIEIPAPESSLTRLLTEK